MACYAERVAAPKKGKIAIGPGPRKTAPPLRRDQLWHVLQLRAAQSAQSVRAPAADRAGLPPRLKAGVEGLSGIAMDDVRVHRNSAAPARLGALAYTQGSDIHLGPGQDRHLPHEAWHVVQQKQGRVQATAQLQDGVRLNDDRRLESEADAMGERASRLGQGTDVDMALGPFSSPRPAMDQGPVQRQAGSAAPAETDDAGAALHALIDGLEALALHAGQQGGAESATKSDQLQQRLAKLRKIASGSDEALKRSALFEVRRELGQVPLPSGPADGETVQRQADPSVVQRLTGLEIGIIVVGLGLLAYGLYRLLRRNPTTRLTLQGPDFDAHGSHALVISEAHLTDITQRVMYYIKWDANVVPGGNHLGQVPGRASDWVRDLSPDGQPIGSRVNNMGGFFMNPDFSQQNNAAGLHFYFPDGMRQNRQLNFGSWWFRLRVLSAAGAVLSSSEIEVNWNH
jgi:hypothetical protein